MMVIRFAVATAAVLLGCGSAYAQVDISISPGPPLGMTSPLGLGPGSQVGRTGIPMGATELATPGVSPTISGASPGPVTGLACGGGSSAAALAGMGSSMTGAPSTATALFDGGGITGTGSAPGTCTAMGGGAAAGAAPMASSPTGMGLGSSVGRVGIPMGSTELGGAGLSPPSVALTTEPSAPVMSTLTPLTTTSPTNPSLSPSTSQSTTPCATTATGVPTISGVPTAFGAPLAGRALSLEATRCR
jgi:hypothetical protein